MVGKSRVGKSFFMILSVEKSKNINTYLYTNIDMNIDFFSTVKLWRKHGEMWREVKLFFTVFLQEVVRSQRVTST